MKLGHLLTVGVMAGFVSLSSAKAADSYSLGVSLDTSPQHVRNVWLRELASELEAKSAGRLKLEIFEAASKFKDVEVAAAVAQGAIDMAMPQYQLISRFVPEADFEQLPVFYGVDRKKVYEVVDGPVGADLHGRIEKKLRLRVLGRPIDLGFGTVFSTAKALNGPGDLEGLKVRVPGGPATIRRYEVMGAAPVQVAWPEVPQALQTGTVSALWATQESVASAKLWDAGVKYAMEDKQAIVQYLPLINQKSFNDLPKDLQELLVSTWDSMVDAQRDTADAKQQAARTTNASHGIVTVEPDAASLRAMRDKLVMAQPELVQKLGLDEAFVTRLMAALAD